MNLRYDPSTKEQQIACSPRDISRHAMALRVLSLVRSTANGGTLRHFWAGKGEGCQIIFIRSPLLCTFPYFLQEHFESLLMIDGVNAV